MQQPTQVQMSRATGVPRTASSSQGYTHQVTYIMVHNWRAACVDVLQVARMSAYVHVMYMRLDM